MAKMNGVKDWLKNSYATHGCSTDGMNKPKPENNDDTPKPKVAAMGRKNTEMSMTTKKGNSSGGGKSSQRTTSAGNGGNAKHMSGIVGSRKQ